MEIDTSKTHIRTDAKTGDSLIDASLENLEIVQAFIDGEFSEIDLKQEAEHFEKRISDAKNTDDLRDIEELITERKTFILHNQLSGNPMFNVFEKLFDNLLRMLKLKYDTLATVKTGKVKEEKLTLKWNKKNGTKVSNEELLKVYEHFVSIEMFPKNRESDFLAIFGRNDGAQFQPLKLIDEKKNVRLLAYFIREFLYKSNPIKLWVKAKHCFGYEKTSKTLENSVNGYVNNHSGKPKNHDLIDCIQFLI